MKANSLISRRPPNGWVISVSFALMIVGFIGAMAWANGVKGNTITDGVNGTTEPVIGDPIPGKTETDIQNLRDEVAKLREENTTLHEAIAEGKNANTAVNEALKEAKLFASLTDLEGPGITVILSDSKKEPDEIGFVESGIIHDIDVIKVINELWNAGAEALSVNGLRVGPRSDFRCVGSTILVDGQRIASPVEVKAIGDQKTLHGAMNLPGGVLDEIRDVDPEMVKIEIVEKHVFKGYTGPTSFKFGKAPEPKIE